MHRRILYAVLFTVSLTNGYASDGYIGIADGLSNRFVTCILQDHNGLIWVGTGNGLNVYDGYTFKSFYTYSRDLRLSNSRITCMAEDAEGNLWVGTDKGLNRINASRSVNTIIQELSNRNICSITIRKGNVLLGTADGSIIQTGISGKTKLVYHDGRDVAINGITKDDQGNTWFFTNSERKLFKLTPAWEPDPGFHFSEVIPSNFILKENQLIVACASKGGLAVFNQENGNAIKSPFLDSLNTRYHDPVYIFESGDNKIWVAYTHGVLIRMDLTIGTVDEFSQHFRRGYFGSYIKSCAEDNNGLLWVGTDGGLVKVGASSNFFKSYYRNTDQSKPDQFISIRGMLEDPQGNIYAGSYKGLLQISRSGKTTVPVTDFSFSRVNDKDETIVPFSMLWEDNKVLLTSLLHGLFYFYPEKGEFELAAIPFPGRTDLELFGLLKDSEGITWVGTRKGIRIFDRAKKQLIKPPGVKENSALESAMVWTIVEQPKNILWAGTNVGLFRIDKNRGDVTHYHLNSTPFLSNEEILCVAPDGDHTVWLGSRGGGLMKLDVTRDSISYFNTSEGLTSDIVYGIIRKEKYLWLSTENGICRFDPGTKQAKGYYEKDGIANNEFNTAAYLKTSDDRIYFGGIDGITAFYPQALEEEKFEGRLILTSLRRGDEELLHSVTTSDDYSIDLDYHNRNLTIQVALTDYYSPHSNRFYYRIKGLDEDWISLGSQNTLRMSQLTAGDYEIEIFGKNMNDRQSINTLTVHAHVGQVFYKEAWFIVACCCTIFTVIYLFFWQREKQLLRVQQLRTKIASDLHDEVGSMLTRVSILTEVLKHKNQHLQEIDQIAHASRLATSTMSDVLWSVDARNDKAEHLVDRMREHADALLLPLNMNIHFRADLGHHKALDMQTRQNALFIFKEAVNNIAKHSDASDVTIQVNVERNEFTICIADNGTMSSAKSSTGQGLKNMRMRAREIKAELVVQNGSGYFIELKKKLY